MEAVLALDVQFLSSGLDSCSKRHRLYKVNLSHKVLCPQRHCALCSVQRHVCLMTVHHSSFATDGRLDRTATSPAAVFCGRSKRHSTGAIDANFHVRLSLGVHFAVNNFD